MLVTFKFVDYFHLIKYGIGLKSKVYCKVIFYVFFVLVESRALRIRFTKSERPEIQILMNSKYDSIKEVKLEKILFEKAKKHKRNLESGKFTP